jgi:hypothetical protein
LQVVGQGSLALDRTCSVLFSSEKLFTVMIEHLNVGRVAHFYRRKKRLSNAAIGTLFKTLRSNASTPSRNLFSARRVALSRSKYSAICFSFKRSPAFLDKEAKATERIFGFLLIVEKGDFVAVLKSGLDLPSTFKADYLDKVGSERVERAIARHDAVFEKLRLKNMSTSKFALRAKTVEASDLVNAVATSSASRFAPQGYSVRRSDGTYSATPSTGRISIRADRATYEDAIHWAAEVIDLLAAETGETSAFIRNFARPTELSAIPTDVRPTYIAIDVPSLASVLFESEGRTIRLVRPNQNSFLEMAKVEIDPILEDLDRSFPVHLEQMQNDIVHPEDQARIGLLKVGKTRISLQGFTLSSIDGIFVEDAALPVGTDADRKPLARYLDLEDLFTVLFSDLALAYIDGTLYRDEALLGGGANFLSHLQAAPPLAEAISEKGAFVAGQEAFDDTSVFRAVVDHIAHDADVLLCDDLGDEWADFIGISTVTHPEMVSFYHAKHGARSLSAAAFHDSVGQAIKNLGRMTLPSEAMQAKYASWEAPYRGLGAITAIPRIIRGGGRVEIEQKIRKVGSAPDLLKRVFIVTSSLSRAEVETAFTAAAAGEPPSAHFVQLYWLLMSYFSACAEIGAVGYVVCQP